MPESEEERKAPEVPKKPKKSQLVEVRVIKADGKATLVEWVEGKAVKRATIPAKVISEGQVDKSDLAAGIPFGVPWEDVSFDDPTPEQLADALHNAGIWTADDVTSHPNAALAVIQGLYGVHLATLYKFARDFEGGK